MNMSYNFTVDSLPPLPAYQLLPQPALLSWISDQHLSLVAPIASYWIMSAFFWIIDTYDVWPQYRLHTPKELLMRNRAGQWEVFRDVVIQHVIETIFGLSLAYFEPEPTYGKEHYDVAVWARRIRAAEKTIPSVLGLIGVNAAALSKSWQVSAPVLASVVAGGRYPLQSALLNGEPILAPAFAAWEILISKAIYYLLIPGLQLLGSIVILDTWQYFWHRAMHLNKWLYSRWNLSSTKTKLISD